MVILIGIFLACMISFLLALIVLVFVPGFGLTFAHYMVFLVGALVGTFAFVYFVAEKLNDPGNHWSRDSKIQLLLWSMVAGGLIGGTASMLVKKRFEGNPAKPLGDVAGRDK